jgi:hypothetical protein
MRLSKSVNEIWLVMERDELKNEGETEGRSDWCLFIFTL